jgi:hypothetical protein
MEALRAHILEQAVLQKSRQKSAIVSLVSPRPVIGFVPDYADKVKE